jgi:hypothetical protein
MKKTLTLFLSVYCISISSQVVEIQKGQEFENPEKRWIDRFLDPGPSMFYTLRTNSSSYLKDLLITGFNSENAGVEFEQTVNFEFGEYYLGAYHKNGKILIFSGYHKKEQKISGLVLREFDDKNGKPLSDAKVINEHNHHTEPGTTTIDFDFSPDEKKTLVLFSRSLDDKLIEVKAKIYNTHNFSVIGERVVNRSYQKSAIDFQKYTVNNEGSFIYVFTYQNEKTEVCYAMAVQSGITQPAVIKIPGEKVTISNYDISLSGNKILMPVEFLPGVSRDRDNISADSVGFGLIVIDIPSLKVQSENFDFLNGEEKAKLDYKIKNPLYRRKGTDHRNKYFVPYKTIVSSDGVYCLWLHHHAFILSNSGSEKTYNYSREMIVMKYSADHKLQWSRIVPRYVLGSGSELRYYVNYAFANKLHLFYLEHPYNLEDFPDVNHQLGAKEYQFVDPDRSTAVPVMVTIEPTGTMTRIALGENKIFSFAFDYSRTILTEKKKIIVLPDGLPRKKERVDLLKF